MRPLHHDHSYVKVYGEVKVSLAIFVTWTLDGVASFTLLSHYSQGKKG